MEKLKYKIVQIDNLYFGEHELYEGKNVIIRGSKYDCETKLKRLQPQTTVSKILNIFK